MNTSVCDGRFVLHGLAPDAEVPVFFFDPKGKRSATLKASGKLAAEQPVTVRLEPCGAAKARLVDSAGKPLREYPLALHYVVMVGTPGPERGAKLELGQTLADEGFLQDIDPINYPEPIASNSEGDIVLPVLIPGAAYRFVDRTTIRDPKGPQIRKEFTVKPRETLDLGNLLIEKPRRNN